MDDRLTANSAQSGHSRNPSEYLDQSELRTIFSSLSHELCRPLVSMRAGFDLLLGESRTTITPDQRGHLLTMVSLCDDLLQLTRSYLDYASIVQGSRPLSLGTFTVSALVNEIERQFAHVAAARSISWESRIDQPETLVTTDASRCQQIFGNLLSNALKYTPPGGRVSVVGSADDKTWSVVIADSGSGIPPDALDRVFEPFFRLARDEHSPVEGNGLGLAICRELVTELGGEIVIHSDVGLGTTVSLRFPRELNPEGATPAKPSQKPPERKPASVKRRSQRSG
jgi:signal transduction histidine kinase